MKGKNSVDIVKVLLGLGLDPNLLDNKGRTAADLAQAKFEASGSASKKKTDCFLIFEIIIPIVKV